MCSSDLHFVAILLAGTAAGTINTVVGSGSLITFPTLIALGYSPSISNVSNNIGLVPGSLSGAYGYRAELAGQRKRLMQLVPASIVGGLTGSILFKVLPPDVFKRVVPVLIVVALVLVVAGPSVQRKLAARREAGGLGRVEVTPPLVGLVCAAGVYGGYFGAAQGIILISLLGIFLADSLQRLNGTKNVLALTVNAAASVVFIATTNVDWKVVGTIALGSTLGGQLGAKVGRKLNPKLLRTVIVAVGVTALIHLL